MFFYCFFHSFPTEKLRNCSLLFRSSLGSVGSRASLCRSRVFEPLRSVMGRKGHKLEGTKIHQNPSKSIGMIAHIILIYGFHWIHNDQNRMLLKYVEVFPGWWKVQVRKVLCHRGCTMALQLPQVVRSHEALRGQDNRRQRQRFFRPFDRRPGSGLQGLVKPEGQNDHIGNFTNFGRCQLPCQLFLFNIFFFQVPQASPGPRVLCWSRAGASRPWRHAWPDRIWPAEVESWPF